MGPSIKYNSKVGVFLNRLPREWIIIASMAGVRDDSSRGPKVIGVHFLQGLTMEIEGETR
jgi:hypothetical protein